MSKLFLFILLVLLVVLLGVVLGGLRPGPYRSRGGFPRRLRAASGSLGLGLVLIVAAATFLDVRSGGELEPTVGRILVATRPPPELPPMSPERKWDAAPLETARFLLSLVVLDDGLPGIRRPLHIDVFPFAWPDDAKKSVRRKVELPGTTVDLELRIADATHWRSRREEDRGAPLVSLGVRSEVETRYRVGTGSRSSRSGGNDRLVIGPPGAGEGSAWPIPAVRLARPHGIVRYARALGAVLPSGIDRGASIYLAVERIADDDPLRQVSVEEFQDSANASRALRERGKVEGSRAFETPLEQGPAALSAGYALFFLGGGGAWLLVVAGILLARAFPLPTLAAPGVALLLVLLVAALERHAVAVRGRTLIDPAASAAEKVAAARGLETTFFHRETARERVEEAAEAAEAAESRGLPEGLPKALRALAWELR